MRKITMTMLLAGAAIAVGGCDRDRAEDANAVGAENVAVAPSETAETLDNAAGNLDNAAGNLDNAADNMTNSATGNADDQGSTDH